jgi:hypothetical protein
MSKILELFECARKTGSFICKNVYEGKDFNKYLKLKIKEAKQEYETLIHSPLPNDFIEIGY